MTDNSAADASRMISMRQILSRPRVPALLGIGLITQVVGASLPIILLVTVAQYSGYGVAAGINGTFVLVLAVLNPLRGRILDRLGTRRGLVPMAAVSISFMLLLAVSVTLQWHWWTSLIFAMVSGLSSPPVSAALRASWRQVVDGDPDAMRIVHSADSIFEELGFVLAPLLAGLIITLLPPIVAYQSTVAVGILILVCYLAAVRRFGLQRPGFSVGEGTASVGDTLALTAVEIRKASLRRWLGPLTLPSLWRIMGPLMVMGSIFGGIGILVPALTRASQTPQALGPLLAAISVGGVIGGIAYGATRWKIDLASRYRVLTLGFSLPVTVLFVARPLWLLAILLVAAGLFVTPIFINAFLLVDRDVPEAMRVEGNTWVGASTDVANGIIAIVVGAVIVGEHRDAALIILSGCGAIGILMAVATRPRSILLRRHRWPSPEREVNPK